VGLNIFLADRPTVGEPWFLVGFAFGLFLLSLLDFNRTWDRVGWYGSMVGPHNLPHVKNKAWDGMSMVHVIRSGRGKGKTRKTEGPLGHTWLHPGPFPSEPDPLPFRVPVSSGWETHLLGWDRGMAAKGWTHPAPPPPSRTPTPPQRPSQTSGRR